MHLIAHFTIDVYLYFFFFKGNEEQSSNSTPGIDNVPDTMPIPEVVIGSQEWHHSVPSVGF